MIEIEQQIRMGILFMGMVDFVMQCRKMDMERRCEDLSIKISNGLQI